MKSSKSASVLVLQHPRLAQCDLSAVNRLSEKPVFAFDNTVLRLPVATDFRLPETIQAALLAQEIDFGILPDYAFADIGLILSDMDSTLITIECVDEIAAGVGLKAQVAAITERSMRGELDFAQSLKERVSLLKGLPEETLQTVYDSVLQLTAGAVYLLDECKKHHVKFMLVSGGFTYFTERLRKSLNLDAAYANQLVIENRVLSGELSGRLIDAQTKADLLVEHREKWHLSQRVVLAVGDGANDIPMIQAADIGVAFHAKPKTQAAADVSIRFSGLDALRKWFR
ncbi:phosphoserine phosphatase SerB [Stenoxybacter acetivorans]|uniref:phosphoserine phosphatase SerB n=1 Tax=Stenoxybacter acetivorans TaxID=422441 RepID=UPI0005656D3F|nr:phosphoserine phosphatase SerB [Stenoxybacter acetivorans]